MTHETAKMEYTSRWARKHTYRTLRRGNIWYMVLACPICGQTISRIENPNRNNDFFCDGPRQFGKRRSPVL